MDVKPTISALNKFTADIKELREQLENTTAAADPQEITPQQLIAALDILTECYNQMNGEQFTAAIVGVPYWDVLESSKHYWLEKFQIMREFGWCRLWSSVGGQTREQYAAGILEFFKKRKAKQANKIKLTGNMREVKEC